jgi:DNA polymerase-1
VLERLRPWLESDSHAKVGQNLKYDAHVLQNHGLRLRGIAHDTMLQSYVLEAHRTHGMDALADGTWDGARSPRGGGRQGREDDPVRAGVARARDRVRGRGRRGHDAAARTLYPRVEAEPRLLDVYRRIEMPTSLCCSAWSATGC